MSTAFIVAFTGHRPDKLGGYGSVNPFRDRLKEKLARRLTELRVEHSDLCCISGMALGFDQWAAKVCLDLKIPFTAAIPFAGQESRWPAESQAVYRALLARAVDVVVVNKGSYAPQKMQVRNEFMVDRCNLLLGAWDGTAGGTANCVRYATSIGRPWENVLEGLQ